MGFYRCMLIVDLNLYMFTINLIFFHSELYYNDTYLINFFFFLLTCHFYKLGIFYDKEESKGVVLIPYVNIHWIITNLSKNSYISQFSLKEIYPSSQSNTSNSFLVISQRTASNTIGDSF